MPLGPAAYQHDRAKKAYEPLLAASVSVGNIANPGWAGVQDTLAMPATVSFGLAPERHNALHAVAVSGAAAAAAEGTTALTLRYPPLLSKETHCDLKAATVG